MNRSKTVAVATATTLAAIAVWLGSADAQAPAAGGGARPNVVLITTDDQTAASLRVMKRTRALIGERGAGFDNYAASFPLCCPARTTWITGQYSHNHGVIDNRPDAGGGYENLREPGRVLPVWLAAAGYDTALAGKWIHNYPSLEPPPGWDRWWGLVPATATSYYEYDLADSAGGLTHYGSADADYQTDVLTTEYAVPYIREHASDPDPFFLHLSYTAPHWGVGKADRAGKRCANPKPFSFDTARAKPAPRHADAFRKRRLPMPPSFDEADLADKPRLVRKEAPISHTQRRDLARRYRCELASLLAVDEGVEQIDAALRESDLEADTYVIFTSDNGYMHGEHRILSGKVQPYEEVLRLPMLIRGPGIAAGTTVGDPVVDADLVPTILEMTGAGQPPGLERPVDGRSLLAPLRGDAHPTRAVLTEAKRPPRPAAGGAVARSFVGVRTRRYVYIEHDRLRVGSVADGLGARIGDGEPVDRELYDLRRDPYELESEDSTRRYAAPRGALARALAQLRDCAGESCLLDAEIPPPAKRP
jgi:N-acetylglucosamine-6-sulfatase